MAARTSPWHIATIVVGIFALLVAIPTSYKSWAPSFLKPELKLGLDLAGGTQLDFRISEDEINNRQQALQEEIDQLKEAGNTQEVSVKQAELVSLQTQHSGLVEAIRGVLERRINSLGVSEATITPSYYGDEKHLLVDCPGVINPEECSKTVGKTIQLEFKEEFTEATDEYKEKVRANAQTVFARIQSGESTLTNAGEDMSNDLGIGYEAARPYFRSELPQGLARMWDRKVEDPAILADGTISVPQQAADGSYSLRTLEGIYIAEVVAPRVEAERALTNPPDALAALKDRTPGSTLQEQTDQDVSRLSDALQKHLMAQPIGSTSFLQEGDNTAHLMYLRGRVDGKQSMDASHILVSYQGAERAEGGITRTKADAKARAEQILAQVKQGGSFAAIARAESDGESARGGGKIGRIERGTWPAGFEEVAFSLEQGQNSEVVETQFGYHIIHADTTPRTVGSLVSYTMLTLNGASAVTQAKSYAAELEAGSVVRKEEQITLRTLFFSLEPTGWKDTELNGQHFRFASVTTDGVSNIPIVQIQFDSEGAKIFGELTKRNIGKSIAIFVGGELISAPNVQQEILGGSAVITGVGTFDQAQALATDLNTGAIPAPIHLVGQHTIEATLGQDALKTSIKAGIVGFIALIVFMVAVYRLLGVLAIGALVFYIVLFVAFMKLPLLLITNQHVVLTLAGMAGIILSIGMALDANVLIFERMKEEMDRGKSLKTAADAGFKRAWPSIRDGNASTLITCAILFLIGTSIVRGFAITLALGLVMSLFTAIIVTRWLLDRVLTSPLAERKELFGGATGGTKAE